MMDNEEIKNSDEEIKDSNNEENIEENNNEETLEKNEDENIEEKVENNAEENITPRNKINFVECFKEGLKHTVCEFLISAAVLVVLGVVLRYIFGYYIANLWGMSFIVFLVVSIFYPYIKLVYGAKKNKDR
ncbi:hypothetical protein [Clostridium niameyense]|uniref:hypothetical protein n=1 Tax=Clostridium niameyense TaxID=1622073 RepID=UPI00067EB910|nr:hypothetical protein [Clostridium niameyense]